MKTLVKIILCIISCFSYILPSYAQQAFYIYRNDGVINTFITTEIDSMTYSRIDVDSVIHDNYITQEVYTPDSIYRIPLEAIDSIGFVTPKTVYQPGVKVIEGDIRNYIIARKELNLTFLATTPNKLIPSIGDKLVTTEIDDIITKPFIGRVSELRNNTDGIEVVCEPVELTDIFECYYGITRKKADSLSVNSRSISDGFYGTGTCTLRPGKLTHDLLNTYNTQITYSPDDELSFGLNNAKATISLTPTIDYNAYVIVNRSYGVNISVTAIGNYTVEELLALSGSIQFGGDVSIFEKAIPIPEALLDIYFEFGVFGTMTGKLSVDQKWTQKYRHVFHWEWSNKKHQTLKNIHEFKPIGSTHQGKIALNGSLGAGAYGRVGFAFIATSSLDIAEIGLRVEGGIMTEGTYVPYKKDEEYAKKSTDLYNQIKDREISSYFYYGLSGEAKLFKWSISHEIPNFLNLPLNKRWDIGSVRAVPLFSDTKLEKDEEGTYYASTKIDGIVQKSDVGFALINKDKEADALYSYSVYGYQGPKAEAYASFYDKPKANKYIVYPLVKYMGMDLIAEPSAEIKTANISFKNAEIVDVKSEPKYNEDDEYLFTWYTTKIKYIIQIDEADLIDYIQPIIYDNGAWINNGGKTKVPGNGLFAVTTSLNYDNDANMNWATGYRIALKNGTVIYSSNFLQFSGTPENPTVTIGNDLSDNHQRNSKLLVENLYNQFNGKLHFEKVTK